MVQYKIGWVSFLSSVLLCQASPFVYEDYFAYPRYTLELTEKKLSESSVFEHQQGRHIGQWNTQDHINGDQNQVIMMTANAQPFLCTIPTTATTTKHGSGQHSSSTNANTKSSQTLEERQHTIERGLELLKPLENQCLYYKTNGYWTYEYCHGQYVRQFHIDPTQVNNVGDPVLVDGKSSFILGNFPKHHQKDSNEQTTLSQQEQQQHAIFDKKQSSPSDHTTTTLRQIGGQEQQHQVLVQHWNDGTHCDLTNQPRAIDIQFQCAAQDKDEIAVFEEVSTCHYRMIIATPRLCDDLTLGSKRQVKSHNIECNPIVPEYQITDHEQQQQQQQQEADDISMDRTKQQQQQDDDTADTLMDQPLDSDTQLQQLQPTDDTPMDEMEDVQKSDLVGMISNLAKQVDQLQRSMDQQHVIDQQQQQQQNPLVIMDQHGRWIVAPGGTTIQDRDSGVAAQAFLKQFFSNGGTTSPPSSSSFKDTQKQPPLDETRGSQQQNKKAYEKTYYV